MVLRQPMIGFVNYDYKKHFREKPTDNEFANGTNHINGINFFWGAV